MPDGPEAIQIRSLPRLVGAAIALGAEEVGGLSSRELTLCRRAGVERPPPGVRARLEELIRAGEDPLGEAFCRLRPQSERRRDGAVYTPRGIVAAMVDWGAAGPPPAQVIDPGSGSGRFAMAAALRFPRARIVAVENDPLAALLSRANLATLGAARRAEVVPADYRRFRPGAVEGPTLFVGNPPYVRHHEISPSWKRWLSATARQRGIRASQLAGLHVHFFLATAIHARPGDRGAFITSAEWLDVNYGGLVRELLLDGLGGSSLHILAPEAGAFDGTQTTSAVTCFEVGARPSSIRVRRVSSPRQLRELGGGRPVSRRRLAEAARWGALASAPRQRPSGSIELGEICRVHRGAVTGANAVWIVDPEATDLPASLLRLCVTRARELFAAGSVLESSERLRAVVELPFDLDVLARDERDLVDRFLRHARGKGADRSYVARQRRAWWRVGLRDPAPLLATYMARRPPAIVRNAIGARHVNIAHGLYPREPLDDAALDRLAAAIRGSVDLAQGRTYAGGLTKFEPREMERIPIPRSLLN